MPTMRIAAGVMCVVFVVSAAVQYNDPDPLMWIVLYGVAAALAGAAAVGRVPLVPNAIAAAVFIVLTLWWLPSLSGARSQAFTEFKMVDQSDEEPRETVGLAVCAGWSAAQALYAWRRRDAAGDARVEA